MEPPIPDPVKKASTEFAQSRRDLKLDPDWLNNGPESLAADLLPGWRKRRVPLFNGQAVVLWTLGRKDMLCTKLFAYVDRQEDLADCLALAPTRAELVELLPWVQDRDANEDWPAYAKKMINALCKELGHDPIA